MDEFASYVVTDLSDGDTPLDDVVLGTYNNLRNVYKGTGMECHLTRRSHNQDTSHKKPVWKCRVATNTGIANCPHSKAIDEVIIENAFWNPFN